MTPTVPHWNPLKATPSYYHYPISEASQRKYREDANTLMSELTVFKSSSTLRNSLVRVKSPTPDLKKKGVVYEIPCKDCDKCYIGETGRTLMKRMTEHKLAVRCGDTNNGIAVHAWDAQHHVDWEGAKIRETEPRIPLLFHVNIDH